MTKIIYFDYNATAPILPQVKEAIIAALDLVGNASSVHRLGRQCRAEVEVTRKKIAFAVDASPKEITFTGGGTEGNHLVLSGLNLPKENIYSSAIEHASIYKNILPNNLIPVDENGQINLDVLKNYFNRSNPPKLVSVALANSETGSVQHNLKELIRLCHDYNCLVHTDAVQAFGKIPISFSDLNVDLMTVSAHKIGGPKGVGALISKSNIMLKPSLLGGGQERGVRSGTENFPGIVGLGVAAEFATQIDWTTVHSLLINLTQQLVQFNPYVRMNSTLDDLPNTLNFSTPGYNKDTQVIHFDLNGIALSAGAACSSGKVEQSHVLKAMNLDDRYINSAIRLSLAPTATMEDITQFINVWKNMQNTKKVEGL
jgi:cysteine desulfurase